MQREPDALRRALPLSIARSAAFAALVFAGLTGGGSAAAQALRVAPVPATTAAEEGVRWQTLTPAQREALAPLERDWATIEATRKQKWLALAARFKTLPPEERARITARMVEWAKLTPTERGQARLRFEEARQVPASDRSERWRAYQALPDDQRRLLAARAASAASGARDGGAPKGPRPARDAKEAKFNVVPNPALTQSPKPVAPTLMQAGPGATTTLITRRPVPPAHQPIGMPKIATTPEFVNRSTLLPRRGPQAAAVAPASGVALPARPVAAGAAMAPASAVARPTPALPATPVSPAASR